MEAKEFIYTTMVWQWHNSSAQNGDVIVRIRNSFIAFMNECAFVQFVPNIEHWLLNRVKTLQ